MAFEYWQEELKLLAPTTQQGYLHYFNAFISWLNVTPEELYQWQLRLNQDDDKRTNRELVYKFVEYYKLRIAQGGLKGATIHRMSISIQSFFTANSIVWPIRSRDLPPSNPVGAKVVQLDQIKQLWDLVSNENKLRNRAILMMLKDTGLRRGDISKMNVEDYLGSQILETERGTFRVYKPYETEKTGQHAYVHLGPECVDAVDNYLALDNRKTGPLYLDRNNKRLGKGSITMNINRLAGYISNGDKISPHSFRKTHRTLLEAHMPESYVKKLQGKRTYPYIRPQETGELTQAYIDHYDAIRVFRQEQELEVVKQELKELSQAKVDADMIRYSQQSKVAELESSVEDLKSLLMDVLNNPAALEETKRRLTES